MAFYFNIVLSIVVFGVSALIFYWKKFRANHYWKKLGINGEDPIPLLGNMLGILKGKAFHELDSDWYTKYGRIFGSYTGSAPSLYVAEPELLRLIMVKDFHNFTDRRSFDFSNEVLNSFVSAMKGEDWKRVRSAITPAFSSGKLKQTFSLILECGESTKANFRKFSETGEPADCKKIFGGYTLDVIASAAFGTKLNSHEDPDNIFVQMAKKVFAREFSWKIIAAFAVPKLASLLKVKPIGNDVVEFFSDLTLSIVERRKRTNEVRNDFLNSLMEALKNSDQDVNCSAEKTEKVTKDDHRSVDESQDTNMEDDSTSYFKDYAKNRSITATEFVAQCVLFFLAGYDTTATTLSMIVYYLAQHPEYQNRIVKEIDEIWKKHSTIDSEALNEMKFTDAVISETLRLAPPAVRLERQALADYPLGDTGITVPKGMVITIPAYSMHRDADFFPNPTKFDPERFLPENKDLIQAYTYLPFGAGPRNCIGMRFALSEIKLALLQVYKDFTFDVCPQTMIPMQVLPGSGLFQPRAVNLKVIKRKK